MCNREHRCTGYTVPVRHSNWCETYTSLGATGDGRSAYKCHMKTRAEIYDEVVEDAGRHEGREEESYEKGQDYKAQNAEENDAAEDAGRHGSEE